MHVEGNVHFVVGNLRKIRGSSRKLRGRGSVLMKGRPNMAKCQMWEFRNFKHHQILSWLAYMPAGFVSKVILLHRKSSIYIQYSYLTSKRTDSISTCFAEARAVFAEAILQKITKKWYRGSSRKQFYRGSIRGSCGCDRGSSAEALADLRFATSRFKRNKRHSSSVAKTPLFATLWQHNMSEMLYFTVFLEHLFKNTGIYSVLWKHMHETP